MTVWLTGLPAAGKTTIGAAVVSRLCEDGYAAYQLDGDELRGGLSADLGFDPASRHENVRRAAQVARMLAKTGTVVVASLITPYAADRALARQIHLEAGIRFLEVFVDTPLQECERRDPRGLYARARAGKISRVTGIDDPYERPRNPDLVVHSAEQSVAEASGAIVRVIEAARAEGESSRQG